MCGIPFKALSVNSRIVIIIDMIIHNTKNIIIFFTIGPQFRYLLLIYDHSSRFVKNKIRVDDIVTVRSGKTFSFQIYLNTGMFLFFRTGSNENQAAWMADLKMALGKGNTG